MGFEVESNAAFVSNSEAKRAAGFVEKEINCTEYSGNVIVRGSHGEYKVVVELSKLLHMTRVSSILNSICNDPKLISAATYKKYHEPSEDFIDEKEKVRHHRNKNDDESSSSEQRSNTYDDEEESQFQDDNYNEF